MEEKNNKQFQISRNLFYEAFKRVKKNNGKEGIDNITIEQYGKGLNNNLYKLWNRMSSGTYFPKTIRKVEIPKNNREKENIRNTNSRR